MDVSVVVVAFHRLGPLERLLTALQDPAFDLVVVNVEADASISSVARANAARVVDLAGNPGYAAAVNAGVRASTAAVVVFLNDDCLIAASEVRRLAAVVESGDADVAVPRVTDGAGLHERTIQAVPTPSTLAREWLLLPDDPVPSLAGRLHVEKWRSPTVPERVQAAAAVVVAAPRQLLKEVPLPEHYFLYWEESEWFWWLRQRGAEVQYRPDVTCVHVGGRGDVRPEKSRLLARNAVRCVRTTQGRRSALASWLVVIGWNARLVLVDTLRVAMGPSSTRWVRLRARVAGLSAACSAWSEVR